MAESWRLTPWCWSCGWLEIVPSLPRPGVFSTWTIPSPMPALAQTPPQGCSGRGGHFLRQPGILEFRRFELDRDKNWITCLFIGLFILVLVYALWTAGWRALKQEALPLSFSCPGLTGLLCWPAWRHNLTKHLQRLQKTHAEIAYDLYGLIFAYVLGNHFRSGLYHGRRGRRG